MKHRQPQTLARPITQLYLKTAIYLDSWLFFNFILLFYISCVQGESGRSASMRTMR